MAEHARMSHQDRDYDKTHLSIDTAEERVLIHRDYIAHCLRWSHVAKWLMQRHRYKEARILDVGCGKEVPLGKLLYSNRMSGACYMGVDMNKVEMPEMLATAMTNGKMEVRLRSHCDASELKLADMPWRPNLITCFEVFEHVHPAIARRLVINLYDLLVPGGTLFISTPCWNGSAAANHINETKFDAMGAFLENVGFILDDYYGTFASQRDYWSHLTSEEKAIFARLEQYYDSNLLAVMLAPLHPQYSRNVLWHCRKPAGEKVVGPPQFGDLEEIPGPWSQHKDWKELHP